MYTRSDWETVSSRLESADDESAAAEALLHSLILQDKQHLFPGLLQRLLHAGAPVNRVSHLPDSEGETPLHCAVLTGKSDIAALLLQHGADCTTATSKGCNTPLHLACALRDSDAAEEIVRLLLANNADTDVLNQVGQSPLARAQRRATKIRPVILSMLQAHHEAQKQKEKASTIPHEDAGKDSEEKKETSLDVAYMHSTVNEFSGMTQQQRVQQLIRMFVLQSHTQRGVDNNPAAAKQSTESRQRT